MWLLAAGQCLLLPIFSTEACEKFLFLLLLQLNSTEVQFGCSGKSSEPHPLQCSLQYAFHEYVFDSETDPPRGRYPPCMQAAAARMPYYEYSMPHYSVHVGSAAYAQQHRPALRRGARPA